MSGMEIIVFILLGMGSLFVLVGSLGLARLPDFYMRLHGPTKASTLGVGALTMASLLYFPIIQDFQGIHKILITLFLLITAPVSGHMLAKAALHLKVSRKPGTRGEPWQE
jgi:multicomponent K+:H+ antiporter subunit G